VSELLRTSEPATADEEAVATALAAFIARGNAEDASFDALARRLFGYQYARNEPYRRFCQSQGVTPETVGHWSAIPPAPAAAFKRFPLSCTPPANAARLFRSSGTTGRAASRHYLSVAALRLYDQSLREGFRRFVLPDGARLPIWGLMPPPEAAPESSLSYMLGSLMAADPGRDHRFFWSDAGPDVPALQAALRALTEPVILFGTAFAWVLFFDAGGGHLSLPPGSRLLETGGFKGRSRAVSREELYALFRERLGLPATHCLAEYGMCELCSQFYDATLIDHFQGQPDTPRKVGPPWSRTRVIDPRTGREVPPDETGILVHYDLANLNSVLAVATEDLGRRLEEGFELLGRAPGAELRGCSLTVEEWQARA